MVNLYPSIGYRLSVLFLITCSYFSSSQKVLAENPTVKQSEQFAQAETAYSNNRYQKAINLWLKIIESKSNSLSQAEIALVQLNIASTFFHIGDYGAAVRHWQKAIEIYQEVDSDKLLAASLVDQARAYLALGQTDFALKRLDEALNLVEEKPREIQAENNRVLATAYLTLGNINILRGQDLQAEKNYHSSYQYASTAQEKTVAQNNLSQLFWARAQNYTMPSPKAIDNHRLALEAAQKAVELSENIQSLATVDALLQLVRVSNGEENFERDYYLQTAEIILSVLPNSTRKVYALINLSEFQPNPVATLRQAEEIAKQIQDNRSASFALGNLGKYYEQKKQYQQAQNWTNQARLAASYTQADDSLYRWDWQAGRIYTMLAQTDNAIEAYFSAIASLQRIRRELAIEQEKQINFELEIEPVYRELIQLLLADNPDSKQIKQALDVMELLQLSELEHFFKDDCLELTSERELLPENKMGLIQTIVLPEETYLILQIQNQQIQSIKIDISSSQLEELVRQWRLDLETRENDNYLFSGRQLYHLLLEPIESELSEHQLKTLIFINDGILRNVPMAALHDGKQFLGEQYAVGISLGLNLQIKPVESKTVQTKILAFGLSAATDTFPALPYVQREINSLSEVAEVEQFLNSEFIIDKMEKELMNNNFPLVHIATHGQFNGTLEESFLETYQGQINLLDLENILSSHQINFPANPIKLLTLSACETAAGDKRAVLGLAGVAIRSGVNNVIGSLWSIDDEQVVSLVADFYRYLLESKMSQFEALRQAQINTIGDPNSHPAIWSNLILIVN